MVMPKYNGKCPENNEIDIYTGCTFGCVYCIAKSRHADASAPVSDVEVIAGAAARADASSDPYYLSPWTDAYQHQEADKLLARGIIEILANNDAPFFIITKGSLILRDIEFFKDRRNAFVAISLNTLDDGILDRFEPNAPGASERKSVITELLSTGRIRTVVKIDPVIPGITDSDSLGKLVSWLCEIKPYAITAETLRLTGTLANDLKAVLGESDFGAMMSHYPALNEEPRHPHMNYRLALFRGLADEFRKNGIRSSFCKASLPEAITPYDCRGGY